MTSEPLTVLCVDDEPDFADLTATFLERERDTFSVITETSARDGLARLAQEPIDCIVSDYEMPEMDGLAFLRAVREDYPDLPFLLFTGKGSEDVAEDAIQAGVTSYQQKVSGSAQYAVLANRIQTHVKHYRTRQHACALEQEYELVAEASTDTFWTYDLRTETVTLSDGIRHFGYEPPTVGTDFDWWIEHIHSDDRDRIRQLVDALFAREEAAFDELTAKRGEFSAEYRFQRFDGTYAHCRGRGILLFEDDEPVKMVGTMTDITERKEQKQNLRQATQQLQTVIETTPAAIWMLDLDGRHLLLNKYTRKLLGVENEQVIGRPIAEFLPRDLVERFRENQQRALDTGGTVELEEHIPIGDEVHTFLTFTSPVYDADGEPYATCGIATDITAQKTREQGLTRQNERLDQFDSLVSHDLRNPLTMARGYLELAQEECDSEHLASVATAHSRIESLIEGMLMLAREGYTVTDIEEVPLQPIVNEAWCPVENRAATLDVPESLDALMCDRDSVRRMLENLFRNALDHGGEDVTVRVAPLADGEGFYVEDDGEGFPEADCNRLFEWGYSRQENGHGFGLSIVEQVVGAHGWTITASTGRTGGARFEISTNRED